MAYFDHKLESLNARIASLSQRVEGVVRALKESDSETMSCQIDKAILYLDYLDVEWIHGFEKAYASHLRQDKTILQKARAKSAKRIREKRKVLKGEKG